MPGPTFDFTTQLTAPPSPSPSAPLQRQKATEMDAPVEDSDIKLQKVSADLISEFDTRLPLFLFRRQRSGDSSQKVRKQVTAREADGLIAGVCTQSTHYPTQKSNQKSASTPSKNSPSSSTPTSPNGSPSSPPPLSPRSTSPPPRLTHSPTITTPPTPKKKRSSSR